MKVTFVYPGIGGQGFDSIGKGMDSGWISHGIAILAACVKRVGHEADLLDLRALKGWDHFRQLVSERNPDIIAVSLMSVDFDPAMQVLEIVREVNPNIITFVGGPHPTIMPQEMTDNPNIDYVFVGEGEESLPDALDKLARGEKIPHVITGTHPDLDTIPFSDHDLFLDEWAAQGFHAVSPEAPFAVELPAPFITLIAGRGCMYNCSYCQPAERYIFGRKVRHRSPDNIITELKEKQAKYHFASFMFHDDCLTEDREWVIEFCEKYMAEGFTQPFFCQSRADIIVKNEDLVALMAKAGLRGYFIGFESGSDRVLRFIRKGTKRWHNIEAGRICKKYGIAIWANYMMGLPTETKEEVLETISMLKEIDPDYYSPAFYTPHPGSDLYDYCIESGLSLIKEHGSYRRNPDEEKIVGVDYKWLHWAVEESQKRKFKNRVKRRTRYLWHRYANPKKIWRKLTSPFRRNQQAQNTEGLS